MKKILLLFVFTSLLISCGSSQPKQAQDPTQPYTLYENIDVQAVYQNMPKGMFIKRLSGPRDMYKVSVPLEDGKRYRVTIRVPNYSPSNVKEAEVIAYTLL
jgi:NADH:ubiquinone oxidoreductase subunit D